MIAFDIALVAQKSSIEDRFVSEKVGAVSLIGRDDY